MSRARQPQIKKITLEGGQVRYRVVMDTGMTEDGQRRQSKRTFDTERAAKKWIAETRLSVGSGEYVAKSKITVGEFLDSWLRGLEIRPNTRDGYRADLKPVYDALKDVPLQALTAARVAALKAECRTTGGRDGEGRSPRTVNLMLTVLAMALDSARRQRLVEVNVASADLVPRVKATKADRDKVEARSARMWTNEEISGFLDHVEGDHYYAGWCLTFMGLRRSEVLGATWGAVDLAAGTIRISQGRTCPKTRKVDGQERTVVDAPKRVNSERTLSLSDRALEALTARRDAREAFIRKHRGISSDVPFIGTLIDPREFIVLDEIARPISPEFYSTMWRRHVAALGLPPIRLHDARHAVATLLEADPTVSIAEAAKVMGHDPRTFLAVYVHGDATKDTVRAAINSIGASRSRIGR